MPTFFEDSRMRRTVTCLETGITTLEKMLLFR